MFLIYLHQLGLPEANIMTSMVHVGKNQFSWDGKNPVKNINVNNETPGNCTGLSRLQLSTISCDEKHHFMCEAAAKEQTASMPSVQKTVPGSE